MYSINDNLDEYQRYQRGFGNRRALGTRLKHHYSKESLYGYDNQDNLRDDKHLFPNTYELIEPNDLIQQEQQQQQEQRSPTVYRK